MSRDSPPGPPVPSPDAVTVPHTEEVPSRELLLQTPPPGTMITESLQIVDKVGEGGMGIVLRARDTRLDRDVAIKLIRPEWLLVDSVRQQFLAEARAMAKVRHRNVVEIHSFGEREGVPFFIMEYVPGVSLEHWLDQRGGPPLAVDEAIGFMEQICRGVQAIHDAGAIHRDIKPSNVLIGPGFRVAVTDFGLVRMADPLHSRPTSTGGTPAFMCPEVIGGLEVPPKFWPRADVYALGVMAYELLTGRLPFDTEDVEAMLRMHLEDPPPTPTSLRPELPPGFDKVLLKALRKIPTDRTPSPAEFRQELLDARSSFKKMAFSTLHIVVADGDAQFAELIREILLFSLPGVRLELVKDGKKALKAVRSQKTSLLIADLGLPELNGMELVHDLREDSHTIGIPILMVSDVGSAEDWKLLHRMGVDCFLPKPINPLTFTAVVKALVGKTGQ